MIFNKLELKNWKYFNKQILIMLNKSIKMMYLSYWILKQLIL